MAKKAKKSNLSIIWIVIALAMSGLMIGSFFMPLFKFEIASSILGANASSTISCLDIIKNGAEGNANVVGILGLIIMILGCILLLSIVASIFVKNKNLSFANIGLAVLTVVLSIIALILATTVTDGTAFGGELLASAIKLSVAPFMYLLGSIVASVMLIMARK